MIKLKTTILVGAVTLILLACNLSYAEEGWVKFQNNLRAAERGDKEAQYRVGMDYWTGWVVDKDESASFKWFLKSAQQGHLSAQEKVAQAYDQGRGVAKDPEQAFHWYQKAAAQGSKEAMMSVAHMYKNGEGVAQDLDRAKSLFLQLANSDSILYHMRATLALWLLYETHYPDDTAAILHWMETAYEAGNRGLRHRLIQAYTDGKLVPPDDKKAFGYLTSSRDLATPDEEFLLALMYEEGRGTKKNKKKAEEIFERLIRFGHPDALVHQKVKEKERKAKRGDAQAQYEIAQAYLGKKTLSARDKAEVIKWLEAAAKKKHWEAQWALVGLYIDENSPFFDRAAGIAVLEAIANDGDPEAQVGVFLLYREEDEAKARRFLDAITSKAETGDALAQYTLYVLYSQLEEDAKRIHWLKAAADNGYHWAQYYLAGAYYTGQLGLPQDMEQAVDLYYAAAEQGVVAAMYDMGRMFQHGHGVDADLELALEWYEAAAEYNYAPAVQKVAELKASR